MAITFPATSESPFTDPNGTVWTWNGSAWTRRNLGVGSFAGAVWDAGTEYAEGAPVTNQWGELVTARTAHTSGASYDATDWFTPGAPDGGTVIDFTRLADGALTTVRPAYGQIDYYSPEASLEFFEVSSGRLIGTESPATQNLYLQVECSDTVQHAWAVFEVSATPESNKALLILLPGPDAWFTGGGSTAAVHSQLWANVAGVSTFGKFQPGGYGVPGDQIGGGTINMPYSLVSRHVRYDVTMDKLTGEVRYYIDGVLVQNYTDSTLIGYSSKFAILEISGATYSVLSFGASPVMPLVGPDQVSNDDNAFVPGATTLTSSYQLVRSINVKYGRTGRVLVEWFPYLSCTAGTVHFAMGEASAGAPDAQPANRNQMCEATTNCRVPFREHRTGTPGTTENVGIYAKTTGTATIRSSSYGGTGPTVTPIVGITSIT